MDVFDLLHEKLDYVIERQCWMLENWSQLKNTEILGQSSENFANLASYLQIEENLLYPALQDASDDVLPRLEPAMRAHRKIEDILDSSTMMHVDEPSHEYKVNMGNLLELLEAFRRYDETLVFPEARKRLSPQSLDDIHKRVREELWHEASAHPKLR